MPWNLRCGRVLAGTEADDAGGAHGVGHPEHQRQLGTDDHHVGLDPLRQGDDVRAGGDVDIVLFGQAGGTGVARSHDEVRDLRIPGQRQEQGMFTGTGADYQDAHERSA